MSRPEEDVEAAHGERLTEEWSPGRGQVEPWLRKVNAMREYFCTSSVWAERNYPKQEVRRG